MSIARTPDRLDVEHLDDGPDPWEMVNGIYYPSSDGEQMGESDWHFTALATLFDMLRERYRRGGAYVAADMMFYYEEGNPKAVRSPDCMVILGVTNQPRHSWMSWVEGAMPSVVFELISKKTRREDLGPKRKVYERLGIPEYFLFDPVGTILRTDRLRGWRIDGERYVPIEPDQPGRDGLTSRELGLHIYAEEELLRLVDPVTLRTLKTYGESTDLYERARGRLREVKRYYKRRLRRRDRAAEADRRLAQEERLRFLEQSRIAEEQSRIAEGERLRADALATELEQLRARLADDRPRNA